MDENKQIQIKHSTPERLAMPFVRYFFFRQEKRASSRGLALVTKGIWEMFGARKAKSILYYVGRQAGREISEATEVEYKTSRAKSWSELLGNIEIFCDLLAGAKGKIVSATENQAIIHLYDSPSCYKLSGFSEPCCDYMAGIFASLPPFDFDGAQASCKEIRCKGNDPDIDYCEFELNVVWPNGKMPE